MTADNQNQVELAGRMIDLSTVLPLRMRDVLELAKSGIDVDKATSGDVPGLFRMCLYMLHKADPTVTEHEVGALLPEEFLALWERIAEINGRLKEAERPFSPPSTSSAASTAGVPPT